LEASFVERIEAFSDRALDVAEELQRQRCFARVVDQLVGSGTSVGAQYREAQHAKSDADMISKIEAALQELEESSYWLELLEEMNFFPAEKLKPIQQETKELTAIFVTIAKKVKARKK